MPARLRPSLARPLSACVLVVVTAAGLAGCAADATPGEQVRATGVADPTATAPATSAASGAIDDYVAMGDSYTAAPLDPLSKGSTIDDCLRSPSNYPTLVADELGIEVRDVSCSGASTTSIFHPQRFTTKVEPPQIDAVTADTDLVTVGIGANDFRFFSEMVVDCLDIAPTDPEGAPCQAAHRDAAGRDALRRNLVKIRTNVRAVVRAIRERAPRARVLLVGYPQIIPSTGTCPAKLPIATGDYPYTLDLNLRLAQAVRNGGVSAGAEYVDLVTASQDHDICAEDPWIAGFRGKDNKAAGLHPYPAEQQAVASLVTGLLG